MSFTVDTVPGHVPEPVPPAPDTYKVTMDLSLEQLDQLHALLGQVTGGTTLGRLTSKIYFKIDSMLSKLRNESGCRVGKWHCSSAIEIRELK